MLISGNPLNYSRVERFPTVDMILLKDRYSAGEFTSPAFFLPDDPPIIAGLS